MRASACVQSFWAVGAYGPGAAEDISNMPFAGPRVPAAEGDKRIPSKGGNSSRLHSGSAKGSAPLATPHGRKPGSWGPAASPRRGLAAGTYINIKTVDDRLTDPPGSHGKGQAFMFES